MNGKASIRNEIDKKKTALGDIKNAPVTCEQKGPMKTEQTEIIDEIYEREFASSEDVDYHKVWTEKLALTDDEITRWITMLNRHENWNEEVEPPPPIHEEEIPLANGKSFISLIIFFEC